MFTLPRPCDTDQSTIKLNDEFKNFVDTYIKEHPDCTKDEVVAEMFRRFGDVVPRRVNIGVACYTTESTTVETEQSLESVSDSVKVSVSCHFDCFGGQTKDGTTSQHESEQGHKSESTNYAFAALGGDVPDPRNPMSIANYRMIPCSWRVTHFGDEFTAVYDYLDGISKHKLDHSK